MNIIYIRTSTEDQNPENQLKDCESINKYGQYELFMDKQSAWKDNIERDNFEIIKIKIKNRKVEHLIVWDLDRLYRNRKNLKAFFEFCKVYNCKIHSFRQEWLENLSELPSPFNEIFYEFLLQVMGWMAEDESTKKSERVKAAVRKKGKSTLSYKGNKWGRKSLSTQKLNKIRELQNLSLRKIADELNISKSVVHKYLKEIRKEKIQNKGVHKSVN